MYVPKHSELRTSIHVQTVLYTKVKFNSLSLCEMDEI